MSQGFTFTTRDLRMMTEAELLGEHDRFYTWINGQPKGVKMTTEQVLSLSRIEDELLEMGVQL